LKDKNSLENIKKNQKKNLKVSRFEMDKKSLKGGA